MNFHLWICFKQIIGHIGWIFCFSSQLMLKDVEHFVQNLIWIELNNIWFGRPNHTSQIWFSLKLIIKSLIGPSLQSFIQILSWFEQVNTKNEIGDKFHVFTSPLAKACLWCLISSNSGILCSKCVSVNVKKINVPLLLLLQKLYLLAIWFLKAFIWLFFH